MFEFTLLFALKELTGDEEIDITVLDVGGVGISEIQGEVVILSLSGERTWKHDVELVIVQHVVHKRAQHVGENVGSQEVGGIFNHDDAVVDELMHIVSQDFVIMIKI